MARQAPVHSIPGFRSCAVLLLLFCAGHARGAEPVTSEDGGFRWGHALLESLEFTALAHGVRLAAEADTREALKGPFVRDYVGSVEGLHGWGDGDAFNVNYVQHPVEGAIFGFTQIQNDPRYKTLEFSNSRAYWRSRLKATGWSALMSTQFEIGPFSEASIGNVGLKRGTAGWVDLVVTPAGGLAVMLLEDVLDKYVIRRFETGHGPVARVLLRGFLNPDRSMANMLRGRVPWHRDSRAGVTVP